MHDCMIHANAGQGPWEGQAFGGVPYSYRSPYLSPLNPASSGTWEGSHSTPASPQLGGGSPALASPQYYPHKSLSDDSPLYDPSTSPQYGPTLSPYRDPMEDTVVPLPGLGFNPVVGQPGEEMPQQISPASRSPSGSPMEELYDPGE